MLDKRTAQMLQVAALLSADELDAIRQNAPAERTPTESAADSVNGNHPEADSSSVDATRGDRERLRTRESKVATACLGQPRQGHPWWPIGTELIGRIGNETFTAIVVENPQVKSGRSLQITSGAAQGRVCITPTRAAMEATEAYRQANGLGRGGGVTNGWSFWNPKN